MSRRLTLEVLGGALGVWRHGPDEELGAEDSSAPLWAVVRTADELSVVGPEEAAPDGVPVERGWRALRVAGSLDFGLTGVLASIATPLADAGISIFAISTYDTDYVLVREGRLGDAKAALARHGHQIVD